jgi:RNA polymerase sigma-70 factor (ECF subfamily)
MKYGASSANRTVGPPDNVVSYVAVLDDDQALVRAIISGHAGASDRLFRKYVDQVRRVVVSVLDIDNETEDVIQDVFLDAIRTIDRLKDPSMLGAWLNRIAVFKSRRVIRYRTRRRWLRFVSPEHLEDLSAATGTGSSSCSATSREWNSTRSRMLVKFPLPP